MIKVVNLDRMFCLLNNAISDFLNFLILYKICYSFTV